MANHKSAEKRKRQDAKKRMANRAAKSTARTSIKKLRLAIDGKDKEAAQSLLREVQSRLGKLSKSSKMKLKTASRRTSRLAQQVSQL